MSHTGSNPANSSPWSAPDSIGFSVWNRLTRHGISPDGAGIALTGNTSAIHDRHLSFLHSLTTQPTELASARRWLDDVRIFRRAARSGVTVVPRYRPIAVSDIVLADAERAGLPSQAATVIAERPVVLSPAATAGGQLRATNQVPVSAASAWAIAPGGRPDLSVSRGSVRTRVMRQQNEGSMPVAMHYATVSSSLDAMARGSLALPTWPDAPFGVRRVSRYRIGTSVSALPEVRGASWSAPAPSPSPGTIYRSSESARLVPGANADIAVTIGTQARAISGARGSQPEPIALSAPMSFVPQSASALIRPIFSTASLQQGRTLALASSAAPVHAARHIPDASATIDRSLDRPMRYRQMALSRAASDPAHSAVAANNGVADWQTIRRAVSIDTQSLTPETLLPGAGVLLLPSDSTVTRQAIAARAAVSAALVSVQTGSIAALGLVRRNRRVGRPERDAFLPGAIQNVRPALAKMALSEWSSGSPMGSLPASSASLPRPQTALRARASDDETFPLATLARTSGSPLVPDNATVGPNYDFNFPSFISNGGSGWPLVGVSSGSHSFPSESAGPSQLTTIDSRRGYLEHDALPVAAPDLHVGRAKTTLAMRSVDLPFGSLRASPASFALLGTQQTALRMGAVDDESFPRRGTPARADLPPAAFGDPAVKFHGILASFVPSDKSVVATSSTLPPSQSGTTGSSALAYLGRRSGYFASGLPMSAQDVRIARAKFAHPELTVGPPDRSSLALSVHSALPVLRAKAVDDPTLPLALERVPFDTSRAPLAQSHNAAMSDPFPSTGITATTNVPAPQLVRSIMPDDIKPPMHIHASSFEAVGLGGGTGMIGGPALPLMRSTFAVQPWRAVPSVISGSQVAATYGVGQPMTLTSVQTRSVSLDAQNVVSMEPQRSDLPPSTPSRRYPAALPFSRSGTAGVQGQAAMPLVVARAESPKSASFDQSAFALMRTPEISSDVGSRADTPAHALPRDTEVDAEEVAERAWRTLMSRLAIEQERRGFGRWS
jgi:hypothetical protein